MYYITLSHGPIISNVIIASILMYRCEYLVIDYLFVASQVFIKLLDVFCEQCSQ